MVFSAFVLCVSSAFSESGYQLTDDLKNELVYSYDESDGKYVYSYCYPQVIETDECAAAINAFYQYEADYAAEFTGPTNADYYMSCGVDAFTDTTYEVVCNNDLYFSILLKKNEKSDSEEITVYTGHTFSRTDSKPGSTVSLPSLLGILKSDENDTWLQERQTEKANQLIREIMLEKLEAMIASMPAGQAETRDISQVLEYAFWPEEDFYLNGDGDPVFFLEPGALVSESYGLITVAIPLEDILDEL